MNSTNNIFLIGLMGAGKTTIGRHLARVMHKQFYDSDHEIEARTGVSVRTIFDIEGESGFRKREEAVVASLVRQHNIILATGGGVILSENNRRALKANGLIVYLYAGLDELWARTRQDKNRPLLQTVDPKSRLQALFTERDPLYRDVADIVINTRHQHGNVIAQTLARSLSISTIQKSTVPCFMDKEET